MFEVTSIIHAGVYGRSVDKSTEFYEGLLGMEPAWQMPYMDMAGLYVYSIIFHEIGDTGLGIEAFQLKEPLIRPLHTLGGEPMGFQAFHIEVADLEGFVAAAKEKDVLFDSAITEVDGVKTITARGPDYEPLVFAESSRLEDGQLPGYVRRISQYDVNVGDIERELAFYSGLLGIKVAARDGSEKDPRFRACATLELPDGVRLMLREPVKQAERLEPYGLGAFCGINHLCFRLNNLPEGVEHLKKNGVVFDDSKLSRDDWFIGGQYIFGYDPEGNRYEFFEHFAE